MTDIKYNSPAHNSGKVEDGDEIVQINYQTVVGWQYKKVLMQLQESATNVLLTLKKRPKHTKIYGHLGLIKLPSKKRSIPYRWDNLPSPRVELFHMPDLLIPPSYSFVAGVTKVIKQEILSDVEDSSGTESESPNEIKSSEKELRLYMPKPAMAVLQRRHTIAGDDLRNFQNVGNLVLWHNRRIDNKVFDVTSSSLRDKSVSFGFGLELTQRPTTCLGITGNLSANRLKTSLPSVSAKHTETIEECDEKQELQLNGVSKVVDSNKSLDYNQDPKYICNVDNTVIETFMPIPFADDEEIVTEALSQDNFLREVSRKLGNPPVPAPRSYVDTSSQSYVEAVNAIVVNREAVKRGRLDKSHSTPTYESDMPPAIEPRKQAAKIPPVPPRKSVATQSPFVKLPTEPETEEIKTKIANVIDLKSTMSVEHQVSSPVRRCPSPPVHVAHVEKAIKKPEVQEPIELVTPAKVKTMTSKKKNSLMAKRRKIPLKTLGTSTTIQGHLYRRAKDKTEVAYWAKLYFVLIETALYGFKNKEAQKADCVIFLSGFTVSLAKEVHSKQYAFKVYHPKKTFYLAAETSEALAQWIEYIRQATMKGKTNLDCQPRELFSETECSEDEFDMALTKHYQPPPSKHYHLNFGSLKKKFSNASITSGHSCENSSPSDKFLGFFSSNKSAEKKSADIIPTSAFKTYKKVKEHGGGLQLGATSMSSNSSVSDMYLLSGADNSSILSGFTIDSRKKVEEVIHDVIEDDFKQQEFVVPVMEEKPSRQIKPEEKPSRQHKPNKRPLNFLHASNPNLLDFNFQSEFPLQNSIMPITNWDHHTGMTLHDLMQKQLDEEKKDMYNKLVVLGIEKDDERALPKKSEKPAVPPKPAPVNPADPKVEKIQKRLLPVTPDYAQSFKPEDKAIQYTRSKEGQKLRDFGYELINSDDSTTKAVSENPMKVNEKLWNKRGDRVVPTGSLKKKSGFNWMMSHDKEELPAATSSLGSSGSFRKSKNKIDNKTPTSFATSPFSYEKSLQQGPKVLRKNSAPNSGSGSVIPYFSKLSFSSSVKEKKLLGSPKLHRAIFGSRTNSSSSSTVVDHEIFSPITFPKVRRAHC